MGYKRYQVFVSSTYEDLSDERAAVMNCLLDNDCIPVGMEQFPAMPMSQWKYIKRLIDESDYYLLIVAGRYGSIDKETGLGYTEKEFKYALEKEIPVIAFLHKDIGNLPANKCERTEEGRKRVEDFRNLILNSDHLCDFYTTPDNLKYAVVKSLRKTIEQYPAEGWVRSNQIKSYQTDTIEQLQNMLIMIRNSQIEQKKSSPNRLSLEAMTLLRTACETEGVIIVSRSLSGTSVSAGKTVFCDEATARLEAIWTEAVEELESSNFVKDPTGKREIFKVTKSGYEYNEKSESSGILSLKKQGYDDADIAIVSLISENNKCSIADISQTLGFARATTVRRIKRLQEKGIIERVGSPKNGIWKVIEEKN